MRNRYEKSNYMHPNHRFDGSFSGDRSLEELEDDGFREDPSVFRQSDTLRSGFGEGHNVFLAGLDF